MFKKKKKRVFLIDSENTTNFEFVNTYDLNKNDTIIIFVPDKNTGHNIKLLDLQNILNRNVTIKCETACIGTPNAMDFAIVTHLSILSTKNKYSKYYIVSNDNGFAPTISLLQRNSSSEFAIVKTIPDGEITKKIPAKEIQTGSLNKIKNKSQLIEYLKILHPGYDFKESDLPNPKNKSKLHSNLCSMFGQTKGAESYRAVKQFL